MSEAKKRGRNDAPGEGEGSSAAKKHIGVGENGKPKPAGAVPDALRAATEMKTAKPAGGAFVDPNIELSQMPGWWKDWRKHAELVFTVNKLGMRKDKVKIDIVYKGTQKPYKFLSPAHQEVQPWGPPWGDMGNEPMKKKLREAKEAGYVDGLPMKHQYRFSVPTYAWDKNLQDKDGCDPYCIGFVDEFPKDISDAIAEFGLADVTSLKEKPNLFEHIKAEEEERWTAASGKPKEDCILEGIKRKVFRGAPIYVPKNKQTNELLKKNRRLQMMGPVTKPQYEEHKARGCAPCRTPCALLRC
jgi:hypothetical protein